MRNDGSENMYLGPYATGIPASPCNRFLISADSKKNMQGEFCMKKLYAVISALYLAALLASCGSAPQTEAGAAPQPVEAPKAPCLRGTAAGTLRLPF
jgi:hypothetical protein